jgi:hypothetical protein
MCIAIVLCVGLLASYWMDVLGPTPFDENYFRLLPSGQDNVTAEEGAMLAAMFAENGKLPARRLS